MYQVVYGSIPGASRENFEARSEKEARAKALRKIKSEEKAGRYDAMYHGKATLYRYGPGESEVWSGSMWYSEEPTKQQRREVAL